jgi:hypothetical protein
MDQHFHSAVIVKSYDTKLIIISDSVLTHVGFIGAAATATTTTDAIRSGHNT